MSLPLLSLVDARVLGVLVEKQRTVPDTYPLSLNALTAGCNQKTSRDPVLDVPEADVQASIDGLRHASLVMESSGGRVMRYAHNLERALALPGPAVVILATLMLRGPQTVAELRANTERMHRFADASTVEGYLEELATRPTGALVVELPRAPGARETRWMHLLSGPPAAVSATVAAMAAPAGAEHETSLAARVSALEAEVAALREAVRALQSPAADRSPPEDR